MKDFITTIVSALVDNKGEIEVILKEENENQVTYELKVAQDEVGKVIGKSGKTINAIRTLLKATNLNGNKKVSLVINQ